METFYDVGIERKKGEALIESLEPYDEWKLRKGEFTPTAVFKTKISEGKKLYDIVGFQDTSNFAISAKLYELLNHHHITGWKCYPVSINGIKDTYYGFQVTGKCGQLEKALSTGFSIGYRFDEFSWDTSDFFSPGNTALLFCTTKVRDLINKNKITNIELTDINTVRHFSI